jgi:hypothetical protein
VRVTFEIDPDKPETMMFDGYGTDVAGPASGIVIPHGFVNVLLAIVVGQLTVCVRLPLLVANVAFPAYVAWILCRRSDNVFAGTRHVATPLPLTATFEHNVTLVVVSTKVTVPVLTVLVLVVVEVNVTA